MVETPQREHGLMVGVAAGNLLGLAIEGWPKREIQEAFEDGIDEIWVDGPEVDDDDLAQSLIIAEAAAEGPLDVDVLARRFWEWGELNGTGMGGLTWNVLTLYGGDMPQFLRGRPGEARPASGLSAVEASRKAWAGMQAGNGALMRCAPIAIRWRDDLAALVRNSIVSAVPTHWDPQCGWSCALMNIAIAAALRGESISENDLFTAAQEGMRASLGELARYEYTDDPPESARKAVSAAYRVQDIADITFDGANMGYTLLTLQAGLASLRLAPSFEKGLSAIVEQGGDTDTNGAVVGAALGAKFGVEVIPAHWRETIADYRVGRRPMEQHADEVAAARDA